MDDSKRKLPIAGESPDRINKKQHLDSKTGEDEVVSNATYNSEPKWHPSKLIDAANSFMRSADEFYEASMRENRENRELKDKLKSAQQEAAQLAEDLQRIAGTRHIAPDLDDLLESQFMALREHIRSFTFNFCDPQISTSSIGLELPDYVVAALKEISGVSIAKLLRSKLHAQYLVQALIWRFLCNAFLTNPFLIWGGTGCEVGEFVWKVQNHKKLLINRRQLWRTVTGQLLVDISEPRPSRLRNWLTKLAQYLGPLVKAEHKNDVAEHVGPILNRAIELAKNLARSRTMSAIQRKEPDADDSVSQKYDDRWMEVVEKAIVSYEDIDFLVSPALVQLTNSRGEAFESPRVIVKAEVCFGKGRVATSTLLASDSSRSKGPEIETSSGRRSRVVRRLGIVANEDEVNEEIGTDVDVDEVKDSASDVYIDEQKDESE